MIPNKKAALKEIENILNLSVVQDSYDNFSNKVLARIKALGLDSIRDYILRLESDPGEKAYITSSLTIHYTYFNRESFHFEKLRNYLDGGTKKNFRFITFWCLGCSTGEEVYTLASWLEYWYHRTSKAWNYRILGVDVDPISLASAENGVYEWEAINKLPREVLTYSFSRGSADISDFGRIKPEVRQKIRFQVANILNLPDSILRIKPDVIFVRNVLIYLSEENCGKFFRQVLRHLDVGGLLVTGISECSIQVPRRFKDHGDGVYEAIEEVKMISHSPSGKSKMKLKIEDQPAFLYRRKDGTTVVHSKINFTSRYLILNGFLAAAKELRCPQDDLNVIFCGEKKYWEEISIMPIFKNNRQSWLSKLGDVPLWVDLTNGRLWSDSPSHSTLALEFRGAIKVLVVEDDPIMRRIIEFMLKDDSQIEVIGMLDSSERAESFIKELVPDVISLDIHLPGENGLSFFNRVLKPRQIPTVIMSGMGESGSRMVVDALLMGVSDYVVKPDQSQLEENAHWFVNKLKQAACNISYKPVGEGLKYCGMLTNLPKDMIILIGASTGGVAALDYILPNLPATFPSIIIALHMSEGFSGALASRLNDHSRLKVCEVKQGLLIGHSTVYFADARYNLDLKETPDGLVCRLLPPRSHDLATPSVDVLFQSAVSFSKTRVIGCLLTGMGTDGAMGLLTLKKRGHTTICQGEKSSTVFGMPKAAIDLKAHSMIIELTDIPKVLLELVSEAA